MALDPPLSTVDPGGEPATHTLRIRNNGDTVEEYGLSVVGPLSTWTQVAPDRLRIYPGDEATATIMVAVPHPRVRCNPHVLRRPPRAPGVATAAGSSTRKSCS
jgi:hypothetical protein